MATTNDDLPSVREVQGQSGSVPKLPSEIWDFCLQAALERQDGVLEVRGMLAGTLIEVHQRSLVVLRSWIHQKLREKRNLHEALPLIPFAGVPFSHSVSGQSEIPGGRLPGGSWLPGVAAKVSELAHHLDQAVALVDDRLPSQMKCIAGSSNRAVGNPAGSPKRLPRQLAHKVF